MFAFVASGYEITIDFKYYVRNSTYYRRNILLEERSMALKISDAESVVMDALWERSPLTAEQVVDAVAQKNNWGGATVRTLLNRLLKKQVIAADRADRKYLYRPLIERDAFLRAESQNFLSRLFDGQLAPFVSHFSRDNKLGAQDLAELKRLIEEIENDH